MFNFLKISFGNSEYLSFIFLKIKQQQKMPGKTDKSVVMSGKVRKI